jgi:hypothetical protein
MIKNYTTKIDVTKTMMEIQNILGKHGATHIFIQWDKGVPISLAFKFPVNDRTISFILPMNEEKLFEVFKRALKNREIGNKDCNITQVRMTGWRILKDWVDSQMALIEIEMVKFEEVFLPYMYDEKTNQTLFQKMSSNNFKSLDYDTK